MGNVHRCDGTEVVGEKEKFRELQETEGYSLLYIERNGIERVGAESYI